MKPVIEDSSTPTHLPITATPSRSPSPLSGNSPSSLSFLAASSKLNAVADNIEQHKDEAKSLIFTSCLSTLDSLQRILEGRGILCLQIDGRVGTPERERRLERFKQDPSVHVLLMSIQTGSVGLTLTVADRVHFVEPQWNPAVEEQAICRAHRMGQTRQVAVIRYIAENSVEETIAALQKKKSHLAKVSLDAAEHNGETTGLDDLKFVLDHDHVE
ncbi:hypothetical protein FJTKL_08468 [Diaporthe vaccinii]|uniref:Helicase C-terminal domain-containing protein n=1 Tax=Diaporthe vaccinii TaxID=105482 RepID=A0ABR4ER42_9PEZI